MIADTPGGSAVWVAEDGGKARHIQSGMVCMPGWPPRMPLTRLVIVPSKLPVGLDVACDYESLIDNSKLDIYAAQMPADITLDDMFAHYHNEVLALHKDAVSLGSFSSVQAPGITWPEDAAEGMRSEIFKITDRNNVPCVSYLVVAQQNGWTIEIRYTVPDREVDKKLISRILPLAALRKIKESIAKQAAAPD